MGCPFGCQEAYRKARSTARSVAYYQSAEGKQKKRDLNQKYRDAQKLAKQVETAQRQQRSESSRASTASHGWSDLARQCQCNRALLYYFCVLLAVLSGGAYRAKAIALDLLEKRRQQGLCRESRMDYAVRYLHEHPP